MDFGNLVFILAALASLIYRAYRQNEKNKEAKRQYEEEQGHKNTETYEAPAPAPQTNENPYEEAKTLEDFLDTIAEQYEKPYQEKYSDLEVEEEPQAEVEQAMSAVEERLAHDHSKDEPLEFDEFSAYDKKEDVKETIEVDLKQAVIYQAILERPQF